MIGGAACSASVLTLSTLDSLGDTKSGGDLKQQQGQQQRSKSEPSPRKPPADAAAAALVSACFFVARVV